MPATAPKNPNGDRPPAEPWEADPGWTQQQRAAYEAYRDMEDRSLAKVARLRGTGMTIMSRWCMNGEWVRRARSWDAEVDRRRREAFLAENETAAIDLAHRAAEQQEALLAPARALLVRLRTMREAGEDPFAGLSAAELVRLSAAAGRAFAQVAQVERLARGLSTENVAGHDGGPLMAEVARKSDAELEAYLLGRAEEAASREGQPS